MENTVIIRNPLIFINETYLKRIVLVEEYSTGKAEIIYSNEIPNEILITFPSPYLASSFINTYNEKFFEENFD